MRFPRVRGQKRADAVLAGLLESGRLPTALLFLGMEGVGKELMARELAKALVCREKGCGACADCVNIEKGMHPDVPVVNLAYQAQVMELEGTAALQPTIKVDTIRHIRSDMELRSLLGGWRVAIVPDAERLNEEAWNALLKNVEEPLPNALWVFIASRKEGIPATIVSRCFRVAFAPLPTSEVAAVLKAAGVDAERVVRLAAFSEGSASRALSLSQTGYPEAIFESPAAPAMASDKLPRELPLARAQTEQALFALAQDLRLRHLRGELPFSRVEGPLKTILGLRQALRQNVDPKAILTLAGLEAEAALKEK